MSEIYWITRFDPINTCATVFLILSAIVTAFFIISTIISMADGDSEKELNLCKKCLKISSSVLIVCILIEVFVPTTKQALLIYGVGGTIDYIKANPVAKQLPDKCVNALDKWVDSWNIKEENDSIKNKK
jgi:hypothetical protein